MTQQVFFIRHAESMANAGHPTGNPSDITLTERGKAQAHMLAAIFPVAPKLIIYSPFIRTEQTAAPLIARFPNVPVEVWNVQEFTYLSICHLGATTAETRRPLVDEYWRRCDPHHRHGPDVESFASFRTRVTGLCDRLLNLENYPVAVFTHGLFLQALRLHFLDPQADDVTHMQRFRRFNERYPIANTEILTAEIKNGGVVLTPPPVLSLVF